MIKVMEFLRLLDQRQVASTFFKSTNVTVAGAVGSRVVKNLSSFHLSKESSLTSMLFQHRSFS